MADTRRSVADILTLLADNTSGAISPQDLRDAMVSWRPGHGQIFVAAADSGEVVITDQTTYFTAETAPTWTLSAGAHLLDMSSANGRLTYPAGPDIVVRVACPISFTCASNNQVIHMRLAKNTTDDAASEIQRKVGTGADVGSTALHLITTMSAGDYVALTIKNATSTANVTVEVASIQAEILVA